MRHQFAVRGDVRGDQGDAHGAGFDRGQVEALDGGGGDHGARAAHQGGQGAIRKVLGLVDQALQVGRALQQVQHRFVLPPVAADQDQAGRLGAHPFLKTTPDGQQEGEVLARFDRADVDEIGVGGADHDAAVQGPLQAQVGDVHRRRRQARTTGEGVQLIGGVLRVDDDARGVAQHIDHPALMLGAVAGATEFGMGDGDQVVHHEHALNAPCVQGGQDVWRVQAGVADIQIGARGRRRLDAAGAEILLPGPVLDAFGRRFLVGDVADDGGAVVTRAQGGEQALGVGAEVVDGARPAPARPQFGEPVAEPLIIDARQLIVARPDRHHPIDRVFDQPFGVGQADAIHAGRGAAFGAAEQPAGVEQNVLRHQDT